MKIYTRTGDGGTTSTSDGQRISKASATIAAYGDIDELTAHLGLLRALVSDADDAQFIEYLQQNLFGIGACLMSGKAGTIDFDAVTTALEQRIDATEALLPPLHTFVMPGSNVAEAQCHVCRTVCRRAERAIVAVADGGEMVSPSIVKCLNRLSDYLFVTARKLNFITNSDEKKWHNTCK